MVIIQQDKSSNKLIEHINKQSETIVHINKEQLNSDIEKMEFMLGNSKNKYNRKNISKIISWLNRIKNKSTENGVLEYSFHYNKDKGLQSYPIEVRNIEEYNIHFTDYILPEENKRLVKIDYTHVADLIAFEMMHRDLGYSHRNIEEILEDIGIMTIYKIGEFMSRIDKYDRNTYMLSKDYKIESTPYRGIEKGTINTYFCSKVYRDNNYRDVVEHSCKQAVLIILDEILNNLSKEGIEYNICSVTATEINLIINQDRADDILNGDRRIINNAIVRVLGRKFEVKPKVQIY